MRRHVGGPFTPPRRASSGSYPESRAGARRAPTNSSDDAGAAVKASVGGPSDLDAPADASEDDDARAEVRGALRVRGGPRTRRRVEVHDAGGAVGTAARETRRRADAAFNICVRARALAKNDVSPNPRAGGSEVAARGGDGRG